jgi:hypothetical protein
MALALSPLLILGGLRALAEQDTIRQQRYQELVEVSREGMSSVNAAIQASRLALRMVNIDDRQPSCTEIGDTMLSMELPVRNVLRFNADGKVICNHIGESLIGQSIPDPGWNERLRQGMDQVESSAFPGMALGDPVIWLVRRTTDAAGNYTGSIAFTIGLQKLSERFPDVKSTTGLKQALVTANGVVVGSDLIGGLPVEWLSTEAILERRVREVVLPQGRHLDVVITPVAADGVLMLTPSSSQEAKRFDTLIVLMIPLLAYLAALLAATWIIDILVLRWLERLRLRISDMRRNDEVTPLAADLAGASSELQQLARAFDDLTQRVSVHEADLVQALNRMKGAFRETHHRVKNNLQVMLSMLKLQGRGEQHPETQHALRLAAQRVSMMAAVHHSLLNEAHLESVDADDLIDAICNQIHEQQGWGEESRHIRREIDDVLLPSDLAVPLAMFIQEAFDILCPPSSNGLIARDLRLVLKRENGNVRLRLCCGRDTTPGEETLKEQEANFFLAAFARQLDGSVEKLDEDPENVIIELTFPFFENTEIHNA